MAVQEQTPYIEYVANGTTKVFPLNFDCEDQEHLIVTINGDEPIFGSWLLIDGAVSFKTAPLSDSKIVFQRNSPFERTSNYSTYNNSFRPEPVNKDLDRIWWKLQEMGLATWLLGLKVDKEIRDRIAADIYYYTLVTKETDQKVNELKEYIDNLVNNITGKDFLPILDKYIKTWDGRTQEDVNREYHSVIPELRFDINHNKDELDKNISSINKIINSNQFVNIRHYRKDGFIYDVVAGIQPHRLSLVSNQISDDSPVMTRCTAKQASDKFQKPVVINASAFKNADGSTGWGNDLLVPNGIHIENSKVVTGWEYANNTARDQACCLMSTGELKRFYRAETTAAEMADLGAIWGQSWGGWLVYEGVVPDDFETSVINDSGKSAKTIICQMHDDSISFILIEGMTGSYGATSAEAGQIALSIGAKSAYNLDGGGSTQCFWGDTYAVPSSDAISRTLSSFFIVNTPIVLPYDSGFISVAHNELLGSKVVDAKKPPLYLRQVRDNVTLYANFNVAMQTGISAITDGSSVPQRYRSGSGSNARSICFGGGGGLFRFYQGGGAYLGLFSVDAVNNAQLPTSIIGSCDWYTEHI